MKKKHRNIVVDDKEFAWTVTGFNCDGCGGSRLCIWFDKKVIYYNIVKYGVQVTPKYIRNIITSLKTDKL